MKKIDDKELTERFIKEFVDAVNENGTALSGKFIVRNLLNPDAIHKMGEMCHAYNLVLKRGNLMLDGHKIRVKSREELNNPFVEIFQPEIVKIIQIELKKKK